jgi:uncharacterized membrane protein required for colicin V production
VAQIFATLSMAISALLALYGYQWVSGLLKKLISISTAGTQLAVLNNGILSQIDIPLFASLAFSLIYLVVGLVLRVILLIIRPFRRVLGLGRFGRCLAALLSLGVMFFSLAILLTTLSLLPINGVQSFVASSNFAKWIITQAPLTSHWLLQLFVENLTHLKALK